MKDLGVAIERLALLRAQLGVETDPEKRRALLEYCELWMRAVEMLGELARSNRHMRGEMW